MPDIDVDLADLDTIASGLETGAEALDDVQVPDGPEAGIMSGVISSMLAQVATSGGEIALSMLASSENVALARLYYERTDAESSASFAEIAEAMEDA